MKTIKSFILLFVICILNVNAQNYKSVLGNDTTRWNVLREIPDATWTEAYFCYSDTLIEQKTYKVLYKEMLYSSEEKINTEEKILAGVVCEDTITGKLWIRQSEYGILSKEYLLMDLNLKKGDSAAVFTNWRGDVDEKFKVDSVYYENNRKIISFENTWVSYDKYRKLRYVEGVGPTCGLDGFQYGYSLLCKYNDSNLVFSNGQCYYDFLNKVDNTKYDSYKLETESDKLNIVFENEAQRTICLYDLLGRNLFYKLSSGLSITIPITEKNKGMYILRIKNQSSRTNQSIKLVL